MSDRLDQLRGLLEEPLLVTNPNSVFYLTGFKSSNAALLVDTDRVQLFTDFRYASAARGVEKVEFVETKRDVLGDLASRLKGRIGFESAYVTYAGYEKLRSDGLELVARPGLVESLRAVKDERELDALRRACAIADRVFERLAGEPFVGRTERDVAWTMTQLFHDEGAHDLSFEMIVASGPNSAKPHARAGDREIGRKPRSTAFTPARRAGMPMPSRAASSRAPGFRGCSATASATGSGSRCTKRRGSRRSRRTRSRRATSRPSSPASMSPTAAGSASRTTSS